MTMSRRTLLKARLMGATGLALPFDTLAIPLRRISEAESVRSLTVEPFRTPLPVPPTLAPLRTDTDADSYEVTQREAQVEVLPGLTTTIWGYNGILPRPDHRSQAGTTRRHASDQRATCADAPGLIGVGSALALVAVLLTMPSRPRPLTPATS